MTQLPTISSAVKWLQLILITALLLYLGKLLFIPLFFGLLIAIVMYPVSKWLEQHRWGRALAITACLFIIGLLFAALLALLVWQLKVFSKDAPAIMDKLNLLLAQFQNWLNDHTSFSSDLQHNWPDKMMGSIGTLVSSAFQATIQTLFILFLTPIYAALFMYHRQTFVKYLQLVTPAKYQEHLNKIIQQTVHTYFNYIKGMVLVYLLVGIFNSIGLFALGVKNPILFGMICAIMTIIPYIGIIVSAALPISLIWIQTGNFWYPLGVVVLFVFVQYLEANIIFPSVVGTQLNVSTLAMLIAIIAGGIIWGVAGMVLFIPFVAILKIMSDHIEEWKPLNLLLSR